MKLSYWLFLHLEKSNFHWRSAGSSVSTNSNSSTSLTRSCFPAHLRTPLLRLPVSHPPELLNPYSPADVKHVGAAFLMCHHGCSKAAKRREKAERGSQPLARTPTGDVWALLRITRPHRWSREPQKHVDRYKLLSALPGRVPRCCLLEQKPFAWVFKSKNCFEGFHLSSLAKTNKPVAQGRLEFLIPSPSCLFLALKSDKQ